VALDFPNSPSVNQTHTSGTRTWQWDGTAWGLTASGIVGPTGDSSPPGLISPYAGLSAPSGWLFCDGSSVSRTTYANLWATLAVSKGAVTSIANGASAIVNKPSHGLVEGDAVYLTTTGALPTGLSINTTYYVKLIDANNFRLSTGRTATTTVSNAAASFTTGTAITTSTAGSGTHTVYLAPYGIPAASTTNFLLPDMRGRTPMGLDNINGTDAGILTIPNAIGAKSGEEKHLLITSEMPSHLHDNGTLANSTDSTHTHTAGKYDALGIGNNGVAAGGDYQALIASGASATTRVLTNAGTSHGHTISGNTGLTGGDDYHNILPPFMLVNYIIKT